IPSATARSPHQCPCFVRVRFRCAFAGRPRAGPHGGRPAAVPPCANGWPSSALHSPLHGHECVVVERGGGLLRAARTARPPPPVVRECGGAAAELRPVIA